MKRKWSFFVGAALLAGYFTIAAGAPPLAVAVGIGVGALLTARTSLAA